MRKNDLTNLNGDPLAEILSHLFHLFPKPGRVNDMGVK